jgi:DNA-binding NarL/FixJ family response regulator
MTLRLLLADDHEVVRVGVRAWLTDADIELVGEATSGTDTIRLSLTREWDVALVDVDMPDGDGFAVVEQLRKAHPNLPVVLFAELDYPRFASRVAARGIAGLLLKSASRDVMLTTLRGAANVKPSQPRRLPAQSLDRRGPDPRGLHPGGPNPGGLDPGGLDLGGLDLGGLDLGGLDLGGLGRAERHPRERGPSAACLTDREHDVLTQLATGSTNKEIAQSLGISYETVKEHVQHVLQKLGVADRTQAAVWAVRKGLI